MKEALTLELVRFLVPNETSALDLQEQKLKSKLRTFQAK